MGRILDKTYEMASDAPRPMPWSEYCQHLLPAWEELLAQEPPETKVQAFLERHPCLVPGPSAAFGSAGHGVFPSALISQPALPDFTRKVPDFMWIGSDSLSVYPILVEIEAPSKRWFRKDGVSTADLTQALSQLRDWRAWFSEPINQLSFVKYYDVPAHGRPLKPRYILVYGRRSEFIGDDRAAPRRSALQAMDEILMTYDRMSPDHSTSDVLTVRRNAIGYVASHVPPTLTVGPHTAHHHAKISGKSEALAASEYITDERKRFLSRRFEYWDGWSQNEGGGIRNAADWE